MGRRLCRGTEHADARLPFWGGLWILLASLVGATDRLSATPEKPQSGDQAARPSNEAKDSAPWHIAKVVKSDGPRAADAADDKEAKRPAPAEPRHQKYLQVCVDFRADANERGKHKFRIVDEHGDEVGELWGWNKSKSLVVFEGDWFDLRGLYLDGNGHREPLLPTLPKKAPKKTTTPDNPNPDKPDADKALPGRSGTGGAGGSGGSAPGRAGTGRVGRTWKRAGRRGRSRCRRRARFGCGRRTRSRRGRRAWSGCRRGTRRDRGTWSGRRRGAGRDRGTGLGCRPRARSWPRSGRR